MARLITAEPDSNRDVHTEHCCQLHGCKYGDQDSCPVASGRKRQSYPCEYCESDRYETSAEIDGAIAAYEAVLSLINSGTPIDGLRALVETNLKGLRAWPAAQDGAAERRKISLDPEPSTE